MRRTLYRVQWKEAGHERARSMFFFALTRARAHVMKLLEDRHNEAVTRINMHRYENGEPSGVSIWHYDDASWRDHRSVAG